MRYIITFTFSILVGFATAQIGGPGGLGEITGPATADVGDVDTYTIIGDFESPSWTVSTGASTNFLCFGGNSCVRITWNTAGTKTISFLDNGVVIKTKTVTVNAPPPATPSATTTASAGCQSTTITRTNNPPLGVRWYWQTSPTGTSTSLGYGTTITRTVQGPIYLRARSTTITYNWSNSSQTITFPYNAFFPAQASGSNASRCGTGSITVSATPGNGGNTVRWYTSSSGGSPIHTGTSYTRSNLSTTTTYYAASYNTSTTCEAQTRKAITATINPIPGNSTGSGVARCGNGSVTLSASPGSNSNSIRWYTSASGGSVIHTGTTYTTPSVSSNTTYYAASYNTSTGCEGGYRKPITVHIDTPTSPGTLSGSLEAFGMASGSLTLGGTTVGNVVKWQYRTTGNWIDISNTSTTQSYTNIQETTEYRAVVKNGVCDEVPSNEVSITILEVPSVDLGVSQEIRPGGQTTLTASSGHSNYRWFKNDIEIQNGNNNQLVVNDPSFYKVEVTSAGGAVHTTGNAVIGSQLEFNKNAVLTYTYRTAIQDNDDPFAFGLNQQSISANIYDGLGRTIQQVSLNSSPLEQDIVAPLEYDEFGRQTKSYLPYVATPVNSAYKVNALTDNYALSDHRNYYVNTSSHASDKAFSEVVLETSPLSRPVEQGAPGSSWQIGQNTVKFQYAIADSAEVIDWTFETMLTASKTVYPSGQLYENITEDEDGNQTVAYADKQGQTILKKSQVDGSTWAETYYIYDVYGQLAVVLPPEASNRLDTDFFGQNAQTRSAFLNTWAFLYDYDGRNRMTMKKVPGADSVLMVYDRWDRLVLTQDGNQRANGQWFFTKYDQLNRPIITGMMTGGSESTERAAVAAATVRFDTLNTTLTNEYSIQSYPTSGVDEYLTVTYYDNYDWDNSAVAYTNPAGLTQSTDVKGQVTGTLTKAGNGTWIVSASYYDDRYRVIQTVSTNHLGGTDVVTNHYDFIGQVTQSISTHNNGTNTFTTIRDFTYDHAGRLLTTDHQLFEEVSWKNVVNLTVDGNNLTRPSGNGWGGSGASSSQVFGPNTDVQVDFYPGGSSNRIMVGLSEVDENANYNTIDYAFYSSYNNTLYAYENGTNRGIVGTYIEGAKMSVKREDGSVQLLQDGVVLYTFATPSTSDLVVDVALHNVNDEINDIRILYTEKVRLSENSYNELGELVEKDLHGTGTSFAQSLDYTYNIRGWLTSMNNADLSGADNDLFGMELFYESVDPSGDIANPTYGNGNISGMKWSTWNDQEWSVTKERAYRFYYDGLNRLEDARGYLHTSAWIATQDYRGTYSYDRNGNINTLGRRNNKGSHIDSLQYTYVGNQLQKVSDVVSDSLGFHDGYTGSIDYVYDANGNMVKDRNKGIDSIYYNHLNLPVLVDFDTPGDSIRYLYDAAGIKLQQQVWSNDTLRKTTDYVGEFIYEDGDLELIQHEEGRLVVKSYNDIVLSKDGNSTAGYTPNQNVTITSVSSEIKIVTNQSSNTPGVWPIDGSHTAAEGEQYKLSVTGYSDVGTEAHLFARVNNTSNVVWKGERLPEGSGNKSTVSNTFTIPAGGTSLQVGVLFSDNPTAGQAFYISKIELVKLSNDKTYDYQYHLKDHLGNIRMTFSTTPENYSMVETFETGEQNGWEDLHRTTNANANTTVGGNEVELLSSGQTGAMLFLSVNKGDTLDLSVNANYESAPTNNNFTGTAYNALFSAFDNVYGGGAENGVTTTSSVFDDALSGTDMAGKGSTSSAPRAFLNYILFDKDMSYVTAGFQQISTSAQGIGVHETISINDIKPGQDGYILMYLSNENQEAVNIHWDDFTVYHGKTNVVSTQDYYPFGLTFNESQRVASKKNFMNTFQDQEYEEETGWVKFKWRNHQPDIGRFFNVDPLAEKYVHNSVYAFSENKVVAHVELEGLEASSWETKWMKDNGYFGPQRPMNDPAGPIIGGALMTILIAPVAIYAASSWPALAAAASNPVNQAVALETGALVANAIDPNPNADYLPHSSFDNVGNVIGEGLRQTGKWIKTSETMSDAAAGFQKFITGMDADQSYLLNGVKFDGITDTGVLLDAKSGMKNFVGSDGNFRSWFKGADSMLDQANRQLRAADGASIQWHFQDESVMEATQNLFKQNDIEGIELIYSPTE